MEGADALRTLKEEFAATRYTAADELPEFQGGAVGYVASRFFRVKVMIDLP